jgi:hypothetical protein
MFGGGSLNVVKIRLIRWEAKLRGQPGAQLVGHLPSPCERPVCAESFGLFCSTNRIALRSPKSYALARILGRFKNFNPVIVRENLQGLKHIEVAGIHSIAFTSASISTIVLRATSSSKPRPKDPIDEARHARLHGLCGP